MWTFVYTLQFLLMPLIAGDYVFSNLIGNTFYLLAAGYYLVVTFLGYNGELQRDYHIHLHRLMHIRSSSILEQDRDPLGTSPCFDHLVVDQSVHI